MHLKIRDDVDLKKLENFGFDLRASSIEGIGLFDFTINFVDDNFGFLIAEDLTISDKTREIWGSNLVLLYDLIKSGIVEKVE